MLVQLEELGPLLPQSFMTAFFCEYAVRQQNEEDTENVDRIDALLRLFPSSVYLLTAKAQTLYLNKGEPKLFNPLCPFKGLMLTPVGSLPTDMDEAEELFEKALEIDPLRLEGIDDYSNVLYVLDRPEKLAHLAHRFVEVGRDRPEVCCVIGQ